MQSYALIADADGAAAAVYVSAVREEGLTYVSVRDGARAVAVLGERGTPDVLIADVGLPNLDGFELVERVRKAPSGADTVIIMVSADRDQRERATAMRAALDLGAVLTKATSAESFRRILKRLRDARDAPLPKAPPAARAAPDGVAPANPFAPRAKALPRGTLRRA